MQFKSLQKLYGKFFMTFIQTMSVPNFKNFFRSWRLATALAFSLTQIFTYQSFAGTGFVLSPEIAANVRIELVGKLTELGPNATAREAAQSMLKMYSPEVIRAAILSSDIATTGAFVAKIQALARVSKLDDPIANIFTAGMAGEKLADGGIAIGIAFIVVVLVFAMQFRGSRLYGFSEYVERPWSDGYNPGNSNYRGSCGQC